LAAQHRLAAARAEAGLLDEAAAAYTNLLDQNRDRAEWWHEFALIRSKQRRFEDAAAALLQSLKLDSSVAERHYDLGTLLEHLHDRSADVRQYIEGLTPGHLRMVRHQLPEAITAYDQEHQERPDDLARARTLASALRFAGNEARAALVLGLAYARQKRHSKTIRELTKALDLGARDAAAYAALGNALNRTRRHAEAIDTCTSGLNAFPMERGIYRELVWALVETNQTERAIATAEEAARILGDPLFLKATRYLALPIVYESSEQIREWRTRFIDGLRRLATEISLTDPGLASARADIHPNFYLGYQGFNDMALQRDYGQLVSRIMGASYPAWAQVRPVLPSETNDRMRIGYIFAGHTGIDPVFLAWMTGHDPARFEIVCYQVGGTVDPPSHELESASAAFHHLPEDLEVISQRVVESRLHVLVYLYIGMGALWSQLAGLRLAPVQCATWGHPMTTGLPTIDYFISNEMMEPHDAEAHYSETLVRLPGIGACPSPAFLPPLVKSRADFGLPADAVVYISPQSPAKYLPQYDDVYPAIARRVSNALIILIEPGAAAIGRLLRQRFKAAFAHAGLDSAAFVRFLPNQEYEAYLDLMRLSDVFLDTFAWSGGLTTLDAIRCAVPVVTQPGQLMRGRQSMGILRQMGVGDTIATTFDDYVEIAVRLGLDAGWRRQISEALRDRQDRVFEDSSWRPALEALYSRAISTTSATE
jgi:protein O-GlcNAc transferase